MTGVEERRLLAEYLQTCMRLQHGFHAMIEQAAQLMPMSTERIDALAISDENVVLAFLKRFEQFEDALHRTVKTISQIMALGKVERLTPRDVAAVAEKLGLVSNEERWSEAVRARNALAHEYPLQPTKRVAQVNRAWEARETLELTWAAIQHFVRNEGLTDGTV